MAAIKLLDCGHYLRRPASGHKDVGRPYEYCEKCDNVEYVKVEWKEEWHSKCSVCAAFGKGHGNARVYAEQAAERHSRATGHRTSVRWYGSAPPVARAAVALTEAQKQAKKDAQGTAPPF